MTLSEKYGFYIMNDEIWSDMIYRRLTSNSLLEFGPERNKRTLPYGFSKTFGVAGLRIGCVYSTNQENYDKLVEASMVDSTIGGINLLSQVAGIACLERAFIVWINSCSKSQKTAIYALQRIAAMPGIKCHKPQATFVIFPDITETGMDPVELVELLKTKYKLAIVPGGERFFGPGSEGHVRICLATSHEVLEEGLNRLEACLKDLMSAK